MFVTIVDVVLVHFVDLDGGVLGVDLTLDERLEDFRNPNIEADLTAGRNNFKGKVFLNATGSAKLVFIAKDAMKRGEKLFGGELLFIVRSGDFEHQKDGIDV